MDRNSSLFIMGRFQLCWIAFVLSATFVNVLVSSAFAPTHRLVRRGQLIEQRRSVQSLAEKNENEEKGRDNGIKDDFKRMEDLLEVNRRATLTRPGSLAFIDNLQRAVSAAGWTFLVVGLLLNIFGYDYVMNDGRLTIDTMEASQFRQEVIKAGKTTDK